MSRALFAVVLAFPLIALANPHYRPDVEVNVPPEGHRNDLTVCAGMFIPCMVCVVCVDLRCVVLDDDLYAGVEWVSDAEVAPASVIAMLFATVRAAFTGCYRIFWIAAPFVPAAVIHGNILPTHGACVHKGFGRAPAGAAVE